MNKLRMDATYLMKVMRVLFLGSLVSLAGCTTPEEQITSNEEEMTTTGLITSNELREISLQLGEEEAERLKLKPSLLNCKQARYEPPPTAILRGKTADLGEVKVHNALVCLGSDKMSVLAALEYDVRSLGWHQETITLRLIPHVDFNTRDGAFVHGWIPEDRTRLTCNRNWRKVASGFETVPGMDAGQYDAVGAVSVRFNKVGDFLRC